MKLTCDLCGGTLQMNLGGQGASCTGCGLSYTMDRLREKLSQSTAEPPKPVIPVPEPPVPTPEPPTPTPGTDVIYNVVSWQKVDAKEPAPAVEQFVMQVDSGIGDVSGYVQQGGIGLGDNIYINNDYDHPYTVYSLCDIPDLCSVKKGMHADLFLTKCPKKILKNAQVVTGDPNPVENAYNFQGDVYAYFAELLRREFSDYELRCNVQQDELNIPVSFMLCRGGKPVTAVLLVNSNDNKGRYQTEKARRVFAPKGITCTHFYENYRNDAPYVIDRIRGILG